MSQAQEGRRAAAWEHFHKESHEKSLEELRMMKAKLGTLNPESEEYKALQAEHDAQYEAALSSFMKNCE